MIIWRIYLQIQVFHKWVWQYAVDLVGYRTHHCSSIFFSAKCQMSASYKGNKKLNIDENSGSQKLAASETPGQLIGVQIAAPVCFQFCRFGTQEFSFLSPHLQLIDHTLRHTGSKDIFIAVLKRKQHIWLMINLILFYWALLGNLKPRIHRYSTKQCWKWENYNHLQPNLLLKTQFSSLTEFHLVALCSQTFSYL